MKPKNPSLKLTKWSTALSGICAVHCLLTPFLVLLLPTFGTLFSYQAEQILVALMIPMAFFGFFPTWKRHNNPRVLSQFVIGMAAIIAATWILHVDHPNELVLSSSSFSGSILKSVISITGAALLALSMFQNHRHSHVCTNPHHEHSPES